MTDDLRSSATNKMVEAARKELAKRGWSSSNDSIRADIEAAIEAALALDPLRQPVAGDVIAVAMDAFNSTTDFGEAIERTIAAVDRARGVAGNDALSHTESEFLRQSQYWALGIERAPERQDDAAPRDAAADISTHDPGVAALAGGVVPFSIEVAQALDFLDDYIAAQDTDARAAFGLVDKHIRRRHPDLVHAPGHTNLMVSPESLDKFMADNPLPEEAKPVCKESLPTDPPFPPWSAELYALVRFLAAVMPRTGWTKKEVDLLNDLKRAAFRETSDGL